MTNTTNNKVLVMTVGTGNIEEKEKSLFVPLQKSIDNGDWIKVVLLPSSKTVEDAETIKSRYDGEKEIEIKTLPEMAEENADKSFDHFNTVIKNLRAKFPSPEQITADFTRGTKAMSAALVLAAVRNHIPVVRYISSDQKRDDRGQVKPGTENVKSIKTSIVNACQRLDLAREFIAQGSFSSAIELLPDPDNQFFKLVFPETLKPEVAYWRALARFYSSWDKFDYKQACKIADSLPNEPSREAEWDTIRFKKEMRKWIQKLCENPKNHEDKAAHYRRLATEIYANGKRRLRDMQYEDAIVRIYRIRELIGQIRLCDKGINSDNIPKDNPYLISLLNKLEGKGKPWSPLYKDGGYQAGREKAALLLREMGDLIAEQLLKKYPENSPLNHKKRNNSLLIHGFKSAGGIDKTALKTAFGQIRELILSDDPQNAQKNIDNAGMINFGMKE